MKLLEEIVQRKAKIAVVGLGYVGLPLAVAFARKADVIGFDINTEKIELYRQGIDPTHEIGDEQIRKTTVLFSSDESLLQQAKFIIVAVPTPINRDHTPDLKPIESASRVIGRQLKPGTIIVYESTVYPGVTEDVCVPILEQESGLTCGIDFKVGYSPERINPGDPTHRLETITKIVSGMDDETLSVIAGIYELVVLAGVHRAESIKVAEAAKVVENCQRDINIAFMNEMSIIFNMMNIDTGAVLAAAGTKWNFLKFSPGLVGGHCVGIDPYYLTYRAEQLGYRSQIVISGRRINEDMGRYVAGNLIKKLILANIPVRQARVAILGFTFKENCPDTRNTRVIDIVKELREEYGIQPVLIDPIADAKEAWHEYEVEFAPIETINNMDAVVVAVAHDVFKQLTPAQMASLYRQHEERLRVLLDLKGLYARQTYENEGYLYWKL